MIQKIFCRQKSIFQKLYQSQYKTNKIKLNQLQSLITPRNKII